MKRKLLAALLASATSLAVLPAMAQPDTPPDDMTHNAHHSGTQTPPISPLSHNEDDHTRSNATKEEAKLRKEKRNRRKNQQAFQGSIPTDTGTHPQSGQPSTEGTLSSTEDVEPSAELAAGIATKHQPTAISPLTVSSAEDAASWENDLDGITTNHQSTVTPTEQLFAAGAPSYPLEGSQLIVAKDNAVEELFSKAQTFRAKFNRKEAAAAYKEIINSPNATHEQKARANNELIIVTHGVL